VREREDGLRRGRASAVHLASCELRVLVRLHAVQRSLHFMASNNDGPRSLLENIKTHNVARVFDVDAIITGICERLSMFKGMSPKS